MITNVVHIECESPTYMMYFNNDKGLYSHPVVLYHKPNIEGSIEVAKEKAQYEKEDQTLYVVKMKLPANMNFSGYSNPELAKSMAENRYGMCLVPATWDHLPDYKETGTDLFNPNL